jgi:hypothetical protein
MGKSRWKMDDRFARKREVGRGKGQGTRERPRDDHHALGVTVKREEL